MNAVDYHGNTATSIAADLEYHDCLHLLTSSDEN